MAAPHRVLYLVESGPPIHQIMRGAMPDGFELLTPETGTRDEVMRLLPDADFVITVAMDAAMLGAARKLRLVQLAGVGFDKIDLGAATRAGIPVCQTIEGTIAGVAEHAVLLTLAVLRRLVEADASVRRGEWLVWQLRPTSYQLAGKSVGLFGLGRIGQEAARRFRAFGTEILYADVVRADAAVERELGARFVSFDELLSAADVISLHAPLSPETRGRFGAEAFGRMKPAAVFVNTARGGLVDEPALVAALRDGVIAGAGLDVFAEEPPPAGHPLFALSNVVLTPHCATGTRDSVAEKARAACDNFARALRGERPLHVVNREVLDPEAPARVAAARDAAPEGVASRTPLTAPA